MLPQMNYCMHCGTKLITKYLKNEGDIPFCTTCNDFRFPVFNSGVSMIVFDEPKEHILLIKQYGGDQYILVAGYVNKGEDAEDAAVREVREEMGLDVIGLEFNRSHYYEPSNTLMHNFAVTVRGTAHANEEIDSWKWFPMEEARKRIRPNSLAETFLNGYFTKEFVFPEKPAQPYSLLNQK